MKKKMEYWKIGCIIGATLSFFISYPLNLIYFAGNYGIQFLLAFGLSFIFSSIGSMIEDIIQFRRKS